jgi:hypothetical protein
MTGAFVVKFTRRPASEGINEGVSEGANGGVNEGISRKEIRVYKIHMAYLEKLLNKPNVEVDVRPLTPGEATG